MVYFHQDSMTEPNDWAKSKYRVEPQSNVWSDMPMRSDCSNALWRMEDNNWVILGEEFKNILPTWHLPVPSQNRSRIKWVTATVTVPSSQIESSVDLDKLSEIFLFFLNGQQQPLSQYPFQKEKNPQVLTTITQD